MQAVAFHANHNSFSLTLFDLEDGSWFALIDDTLDGLLTGDTFGMTNGCCGSADNTRNFILDCMC